jgi:hypothetical protein
MKSTVLNPDFRNLWKDVLNFELDPGSEAERQMYVRLWDKADTFAGALGLSSDLQKYPLQAKSINTIQRLRPDGSLQRQIIAELVQSVDVPMDANNPAGETFKFRGGATLIINQLGEVRYSIFKPVDGPSGDRRIAQQREYLEKMKASFSLAPYLAFDSKRDLGFCAMHRGY